MQNLRNIDLLDHLTGLLLHDRLLFLHSVECVHYNAPLQLVQLFTARKFDDRFLPLVTLTCRRSFPRCVDVTVACFEQHPRSLLLHTARRCLDAESGCSIPCALRQCGQCLFESHNFQRLSSATRVTALATRMSFNFATCFSTGDSPAFASVTVITSHVNFRDTGLLESLLKLHVSSICCNLHHVTKPAPLLGNQGVVTNFDIFLSGSRVWRAWASGSHHGYCMHLVVVVVFCEFGPPTASPCGHWCAVCPARTHQCSTEPKMTLQQSANPARAVCLVFVAESCVVLLSCCLHLRTCF